MRQKKVIGMLLVFTLVLVSVLGDFSTGVCAAAKIRLNQSKVSIKVGNKYQLEVRNLPKNAKIKWTSSNKKRATVSKFGVVKAKKAGTVTIRSKVTYKVRGKKKTVKLACKVTIRKKSGMGKTLVVYFSVPEMKSNSNTKVDAVASASITVSGNKNMGNIQYVASVIQSNTGADSFRIQPQKVYPTNHSTLVNQAEKEQAQDARPAIKNKLNNLEKYDTVFIGYPIWWSDMPQIMYTFFDTYNFSGKTIIPFTVHGGSGLSGTVSRIQKLEPGATVYKKGLSIDRDNVGSSRKKIENWLSNIK